MRSALLLHGKPSRERYENPELPHPRDANWFQWVADELERNGVITGRPPFPDPPYPQYQPWKEVFERYGYDADTAVAAHSASADFMLRWLSENQDAYLRQLVLIAPWTDRQGKYGDFSRYTLDPSLSQRVGRIAIFNSIDDLPVQDRVAELREALPEAHYVEFTAHGHFMLDNNMTSVEFPELRDELLRPTSYIR